MRRVSIWIVPSICVAVAATQFVAALAGPLSPWKGGGFGMFASLDRVEFRVLAIDAECTGDSHYRIALRPDRLDDWSALSTSSVTAARVFPTQARLRSIAEEVLNRQLTRSDIEDGVPPPSLLNLQWTNTFLRDIRANGVLDVGPRRRGADTPFPGLRAVKVAVLRLVVDPVTFAVGLSPIDVSRVEIEPKWQR